MRPPPLEDDRMGDSVAASTGDSVAANTGDSVAASTGDSVAVAASTGDSVLVDDSVLLHLKQGNELKQVLCELQEK
uniref:Uncharacterized protein n=1 Tax=Ascaris lumbricoides TaxID=6252 RepID=A0A0M3HPC5_ASCLU